MQKALTCEIYTDTNCIVMDFKNIINKFSSTSDLADFLDVSPVTVRSWGNRNSIPAKYWSKVLQCAQSQGFALSLDDLAAAADAREAA